MKNYFYVKESVRFGPVSFDDLKNLNLTDETLIWFVGLPEWMPAVEIPELADLFRNRNVGQLFGKEPNDDSILIKKIERKTSASLPIIQDNLINKSSENVEIVDPKDSVLSTPTIFASPFSFNGRIRRTEFWITFITSNILFAIIGVMAENSLSPGYALILLAIYIPTIWLLLAQNAKRCHDRGNSGWYQIIPFYGLWMAFAPGDPLSNEYGPSPK